MANTFNQYLSRFPELELPITLTEEDALQYSKANPPLPHKLIIEHIRPFEIDTDELTEFVPCFQLANLKKFRAVVYWKAGLMNYQYIMVTYGLGGIPIDRRVLAGTFSDGKKIIRSVAQLDDDMSIAIMSGISKDGKIDFDASQNTTIDLEILPDGKIIELD